MSLFQRFYDKHHTKKNRAFYSVALVIWVCIIGQSLPVFADEKTPYAQHKADAARVVTQNLDAAWQMALANNRLLKQQRDETVASEERVKASKALRWPTLALTSQYMQLSEPVTGTLTIPGALFAIPSLPVPADKNIPFSSEEHSSLTQLQLSLPLYSGGRISASIDSASTARSLQDISAALYQQKIKLAVVAAYIGVLRSDKAHKVGEEYFQAINSHFQDVEQLLKKGLVAKNDWLAAQVAVANAEQQLLKASNQHDLAMAHFNRQLGLALDTPVNLSELEIPRRAASLDEMQVQAQKKRLELQALDLQQNLIDKQNILLRGENLPQLQAQLVSTKIDQPILDQEVINYAGLALSWQLFDGRKNVHQSKALDAQKQGLIEASADAHFDIELQVKSAWLNLHESHQRITVAHSALAAADENLRVTRDRYRNGLGTQADVLNAQVAWSVSNNRYYDARYDAVLSYYQLQAASATL
jgi:outer membrane protein